jgi:hypothetical protein
MYGLPRTWCCPGPTGSACRATIILTREIYQCLMYIGLGTSDTLHKNPGRIGPGISTILQPVFRECPKGEVRRITIPRTRVNKGGLDLPLRG